MAELDFSLLRPTTQENAFASAEAGRRHRAQIAEQNAFAKYSQDPNGGIADLMAVNPDAALKLRQQGQQETDRQSRVRGATALANNDFEGAASAYSGTGDADSVLAARNAGVVQFQRQQKYLQTVYPGLKTFAEQGGDVAAAFEASIPQMKQLAFKDEAIAQMLQGFKTNPQATIAGIGSMAEDEFEFRSAGDTTQVFSKRSGKLIGSYQGSKFVAVGPDQSLYEVGGNGSQPAGSAPPMPGAVQASSAPAPRGGMYDQVAQIAQANGASAQDIPYLQRLAQVESNANPNARNGSSTGIFQFQPATFQSVGGGDINSVADQTKAALALAQRDRAKLQQMGVPVTDANLYIMHQQGAGGGPALLTAPPEVNAIAALTPAYGGNAARARQAIVGNGGREDMTAGEFVNYWQNRWGGAGQGGSRPAPTQQAQAATDAGAPAGARLVARGAPKAPDWQEMTPAESARYGQGIWLKNKNGDVKPAVAATNGRTRWTSSLADQQTEDIAAIQTASSLNSTLKNTLGQIQTGRLNLGLMSNMAATGLNTVGMGNANSRNYASFKANLEKLRNDSLRLNKGVQTDGDAKRAWNELMDNINDEGVVKQRLAEIMDLNERAVQFRSETIVQRREDFGQPPLDPAKFRYGSRPPASPQSPAATAARPGGVIRYDAQGNRL